MRDSAATIATLRSEYEYDQVRQSEDWHPERDQAECDGQEQIDLLSRGQTSSDQSPRAVGVRRNDGLTRCFQLVLGLLCLVSFRWSYVRRVVGGEVMRGGRKIYVANHVSLLDTPLLGSVLWSAGRTPILVLGDRGVWQQGRLRRLLSARVGFLIDREGATRQRLRELSAFGKSSAEFDLIVFPEGTRGDGKRVLPCQTGIYFVARAAKVPIVPVFIDGMAKLSSKHGGVHPLRALRSIDLYFGQEMSPEEYAAMSRDELAEAVRQRISDLIPGTSEPAAGALSAS